MFSRRPQLSANDFALLVAIPLTREEFAEDEQRPTDFVRSNAWRGTSAWTAYAPYAGLCRRIVHEVESWGVVVERRATLDSLVTAAGRFKTVTLVAHARGPEIRAHDFVDLPRVRASLKDVPRVLGATVPNSLDEELMAVCLDQALGPVDVSDVQAQAMPESEAFAWRVALYRERWQRRLVVEELMGGALSGGPAIEFHDGLVPIMSVRAHLPRFSTLDLTVCDSVLLAECIRETHVDGVILCNPRPTTPDFRLAVYREAVRLAARHNTSYPDAVIRLRRYLKEHTA
jgi:hypothetical protein